MNTRTSPIAGIFSGDLTILGGSVVRSLAAKVRNSSILTLASRQPSAFSSDIRAFFWGNVVMPLAAEVRNSFMITLATRQSAAFFWQFERVLEDI